MKNLILSLLVFIFFGAAFVYALDSALSLPDVVFSWSTQQCVEVINYTDTIYSCENLPSKFNHVWAE